MICLHILCISVLQSIDAVLVQAEAVLQRYSVPLEEATAAIVLGLPGVGAKQRAQSDHC